MMDDRLKALLSQIIQEYLASAHPVASHLLVDKYQLSISSATVRNEMGELESAGYITHPHTSAGRIPTEKGFRFYIEHILTDRPLSKADTLALDHAWKSNVDLAQAIKRLAKALAEQSDNAIVLALSEDQYYYTGLSNLFRKPEFSHPDMIIDLGEVIDHLDEVSRSVLHRLSEKMEILLGEENPFGKACGIVMTQTRGVNDQPGLLGILGPIRMDYGQAKSLLHHSKQLIEQ